MELKVTKISRVSPARNSPNDSDDSMVLPLTFFDLRWLKFHPTERVINSAKTRLLSPSSP
ncbi:unnamed protein product [Arabidopsis halleri]